VLEDSSVESALVDDYAIRGPHSVKRAVFLK
jgi:hypothetical protein